MTSSHHPTILGGSASDLIRVSLGTPKRRSSWGQVGAIAGLLLLANGMGSSVGAADFFWDGGGATPLWSDGFNWNPNGAIPPGAFDNVFFGASGQKTSVHDQAGAYISFVFQPDAPSIHLINNTAANQVILWGGGGIFNNSPNLQTITLIDNFPGFFSGLTLFDFGGSTQTFSATAGNLLINSNISFNGAAAITLVVTGSFDTTITGAIIDPGIPPTFSTLLKTGTGTLTLTGQSTYPGNTIVNGGRLLVNGSIASLNTFVNAGGTLGGFGLVGGNVINAGNVAPGASVGTLTIRGNYTQTKDGTLTIEIDSKKNHDVLAVGGQANLDGTLRIQKLGKAPRLKVGDTFKVLTASGGVSGEFDKVDAFSTGTIVELGVRYRANAVLVEAQQGSFKNFADRSNLTYNQRETARGLDKIAFRNNPPKVIGYLNNRPLHELPGDFDRVAPDEIASVFTIGMSLANVQSLNLQRRTSDLRTGANGFSAAGYHAAGSGPNYSGGYGVAGPTGNEGKDDKKMFVPTEDNRYGVFLTGVGEWVDVDGDGNARGYDVTTGGFTVGLDYKISPNLAVGVSAGYAGTGADLNNGGRVFVNGGKLGVYGTYFTGGFYVDAAVNGGYNSYDTKRSALQGTARGDTDGGELNVLLGTGYDWQVGALAIGPTATFQYTYVGIDSYTENGSLAPLNIASQGAESLRTALGFKAAYDWRVGGVIVKPEIRAAWQHEFGDASFDVRSSFAGSANSGFTVRGPEIGRDSVLLGGGFAVLWNERTSTYVYYDGELGRERYKAHNVSGGVRVAF